MSSDLLLPERYVLTREDLHVQLLIAHYSARRNKSSKPYIAEFEKNLEATLTSCVTTFIAGDTSRCHPRAFLLPSPSLARYMPPTTVTA